MISNPFYKWSGLLNGNEPENNHGLNGYYCYFEPEPCYESECDSVILVKHKWKVMSICETSSVISQNAVDKDSKKKVFQTI